MFEFEIYKKTDKLRDWIGDKLGYLRCDYCGHTAWGCEPSWFYPHEVLPNGNIITNGQGYYSCDRHPLPKIFRATGRTYIKDGKTSGFEFQTEFDKNRGY